MVVRTSTSYRSFEDSKKYALERLCTKSAELLISLRHLGVLCVSAVSYC